MMFNVSKRFDWFAQSLSHNITLSIGKNSSKFNMHFVCGFPRSGTSWFSEILADYLSLPRPANYFLPIACSSVIHTHAEPRRSLNPCFYLVRDGRDSYVSAYFRMKARLEGNDTVLAHRYKKLFGVNADLNDVSRYFPVFLEDSLFKPVGTSTHWGEHTLGWIEKCENSTAVSLVEYEKAIDGGVKYVADKINGQYGNVDNDALIEAYDRHSKEAIKKFGAQRAGTSFRKGEPGDWKNWFNREAADMFNHSCGVALLKAGYEKDNSWINFC